MTPRPPPLTLKLDNRYPLRSPMVIARKRSRSFFGSLYLADWRKFVIAVGCFNALRFSLSAMSSWYDAQVDDILHRPKLAAVSIALSAMYAAATVFEIFGVISVSMKRLSLIRVYAHLSLLTAVIITLIGISSASSYFMFSHDLVRECVALARFGLVDSRSTFRGRTWPRHVEGFRPPAVYRQCMTAWSDYSFSQVLGVAVFYLLPAMASYILVYTYYRQVTDYKHPGNLLRRQPAVRSAMRVEAYANNQYRRVANSSNQADIEHNMTTGRTANNPPTAQVRSAKRKTRSPQGRSQSPPKARMNRNNLNASTSRMSNPTAGSRANIPGLRVNNAGLKRNFTNAWAVKVDTTANNGVPPPKAASRMPRTVAGSSLMKSSSPLTYMLTPGPPSFAPMKDGYGGYAGGEVFSGASENIRFV